MLTLFTFPGDATMPSHSPYCIKAMALLQMSGQAWQPKYLMNPSKMPMGRLPVLKTAEGQMIPDSAQIEAWLSAQGAEFNPGLNDAGRARSHALIRMVEENLRPGLVHDRWLDDANWVHIREMFFSAIPFVLRGFIASQVRAKARRGLVGHGIAQFTAQDRLSRLAADLHALEVTLADKSYLFADHPTAADCAIAPVLDMIARLPEETPLRKHLRNMPPLMAYVDRARETVYPRV